jgi:uncharacterized protein
MQLSGQHELELDRKTVWNEINNHEMLKQCIPGCEKLEQIEENQFELTILAKVGPIKTRFNGTMSIVDIHEPESYKLVGKGSGGSAGSAKGETLITLSEVDNNKTILNYNASLAVSGKLAQIGAKMIHGTAKNFSAQFFESFVDAVKNKVAANGEEVVASTDNAAFSISLIPDKQKQKVLFISIIVISLLAGLIIFGIN